MRSAEAVSPWSSNQTTSAEPSLRTSMSLSARSAISSNSLAKLAVFVRLEDLEGPKSLQASFHFRCAAVADVPEGAVGVHLLPALMRPCPGDRVGKELSCSGRGRRFPLRLAWGSALMSRLSLRIARKVKPPAINT